MRQVRPLLAARAEVGRSSCSRPSWRWRAPRRGRGRGALLGEELLFLPSVRRALDERTFLGPWLLPVLADGACALPVRLRWRGLRPAPAAGGRLVPAHAASSPASGGTTSMIAPSPPAPCGPGRRAARRGRAAGVTDLQDASAARNAG